MCRGPSRTGHVPRSRGLTTPPKLVRRAQAGPRSLVKHPACRRQHTAHTCVGTHSARDRAGAELGIVAEGAGREACQSRAATIHYAGSLDSPAPPDGRASLGRSVRGSGAGHVAGQGEGLTGAGGPSWTSKPQDSRGAVGGDTPHIAPLEAHGTGLGDAC